jgi:bis(5'-nucleosidyl)-tetraphosphatase
MEREKSSGVIIFRRFGDKIKYLLLHYESGHWEFAKGHVEEGEKERETAVRETKEETGLEDLAFIPSFKESVRYFYKRDGSTIMKDVVFFLAESREGEVKLSFEHKGFKWLGIEEALAQLTFDNSREILRKAEDFLDRENKSNLRSFLDGKG